MSGYCKETISVYVKVSVFTHETLGKKCFLFHPKMLWYSVVVANFIKSFSFFLICLNLVKTVVKIAGEKFCLGLCSYTGHNFIDFVENLHNRGV